MSQKIKSQKDIIYIAHALRKKGKKIVTLNGSFDILHIGHVESFEEAKSLGDTLIVLLNSDSSVALYKGPTRPFISQDIRSQILAAIKSIDYIVIFNEINPVKILEKIKPHIHCNGSDWGKDCIEREVVERNGGKIHILKWRHGFSSTKLITKLLGNFSEPLQKAIFLDRDGTINYKGKGYIYDKRNFKFIPQIFQALKKLSKRDYRIIILTNQSGIGRGYFTISQLRTLHHWMLRELKKRGIHIDNIYYCPHHPDDGCECRKPKLKMLMKAAKDFGISLNASWFVGDGECDIILGRTANVKTIKIGKKMSSHLKLEPNFYVKNLAQAAKIIFNYNNKV